jgi:hypothetical protein
MAAEVYTVKVADRLAELVGPYVEIGPEDPLLTVTYTFEGGYERLRIAHAQDRGASEYAGVYHPNVVCEGGGVCDWCGRTLESNSYITASED